jgi:hypothetical protein
MNGKCRPKTHVPRAAALLLAAWLIPLSVTADDGNLARQLRAQQQQSRFQLMLEQVAESARQRGAAAPSAPAPRAAGAAPMDLGDWAESARLRPVTVTGPASPQAEVESAHRARARQAHDRDQQRILHQRQQRRGLIAAGRTGGSPGISSFGAKRRQLVHYNTQNQRQSLQRKLRH